MRTMKAIVEATKKIVSYPNLYFYNALININFNPSECGCTGRFQARVSSTLYYRNFNFLYSAVINILLYI